MARENNWVYDILNWSTLIYEYHIYPNIGGYYDQSAFLLDSIQECQIEIRRYKE